MAEADKTESPRASCLSELLCLNFDKWIRTVCFQQPPKSTLSLAKMAWEMATKVERERCAIVGGHEAEKCRLPDWERVADAIRSEA